MTDWLGVIAVGSSVTGGCTFVTAIVLTRRRRTVEELPGRPVPWTVERVKGAYSVVTTESVPALGIAPERTSYDGYEEWQAIAVARWLNDETDFRALDQMLLDEATKRKAEAEAREDRRRRGGDPIYELGRAEPIDYIEPPIYDHIEPTSQPPARRPIAQAFTSAAFAKLLDAHDGRRKDVDEYERWTRSRLEALVRQRHHLTLHQMGLLGKSDLVKILAFDMPLPAPSTSDIHTEYDLRQALAAWRDSVRANDGEMWSVEQREQLHFLEQRASTLGLKHVLLSVMHADPATFDDPWQGMPTTREWR